MRTFDDTGVRFSRRARLSRDVLLIRRLTGLLWTYVVVGTRVRRRYRWKERHNEVFLVDEEMPS